MVTIWIGMSKHTDSKAPARLNYTYVKWSTEKRFTRAKHTLILAVVNISFQEDLLEPRDASNKRK